MMDVSNIKLGGGYMRILWLIILFASLVILSACAETKGKTQTLQQFYKDANIVNVDKVIIQHGSGVSKTITNQEEIDAFLALINEIVFTPKENQEGYVGWAYRIALFDGEKEFKFTLGRINNTYYDSNPAIFPIVDDYYKQLDIKEE